MDEQTNLKGQVAIISGGLGDIGRAIALALATRGADVALGDVRALDDHETLLKRICGLGVRARYDRVDVTEPSDVDDWVAAVEKDFGPTALVIPNAALGQDLPFTELSPETWRRELAVDLDGAFYLARSGTRCLLRRGLTGRVVFIGSWVARVVHRHIPAYCVAKAGLRMLCRCMAAELSPHGILVNEVAPGYVDAGLSAKYFDAHPGSREIAGRAVPVRRLIEPEEVAAQVAYLCDPLNRHFSGMTLLMDGGLTLLGTGGQRLE